MNRARTIKAFSRFYRNAPKNKARAFKRLVKTVLGKPPENISGEKLLESLEERLKSALEHRDNEFGIYRRVYSGGKAFRGKFTFKSVMKGAAVLDERDIPEEKRILAALSETLTPLSFLRAVFLSKENRRALLKSVFDTHGGEKEGSIDIREDFPLIYGAFKGCYGIDLVKDEIGYKQFAMLMAAMPKNTALCDEIRKRGTKMPFDKGISEVFDRLVT
ncbi:MAG: Gp15 family bacteriophage protein [Ruminiclostridium sp.]